MDLAPQVQEDNSQWGKKIIAFIIPPSPKKIDFQFKIGLIHATDGFS
jgi:hypothetical protein